MSITLWYLLFLYCLWRTFLDWGRGLGKGQFHCIYDIISWAFEFLRTLCIFSIFLFKLIELAWFLIISEKSISIFTICLSSGALLIFFYIVIALEFLYCVYLTFFFHFLNFDCNYASRLICSRLIWSVGYYACLTLYILVSFLGYANWFGTSIWDMRNVFSVLLVIFSLFIICFGLFFFCQDIHVVHGFFSSCFAI